MQSQIADDILARLEPDIKEQLQKHFDDQTASESELKIKYERLRVDSEQRYFEFEKQQLSDRIRLEAESKSASDLRLQVSDLEKKYGDVAEKYRELQLRYFARSEHWAQQEQLLSSAKSQLEIEKVELTDLLDKRNREIDRLKDDWKVLSDQLNEATMLRITAENKAGESKSELVILQHREARLNQELDGVKQQNEWLNKEVQERVTELLTIKKEKNVKILELQSHLDESVLESEQVKQSLESARTRNGELNEQIEMYMEKLRDARDANTHLEEQYRQELIAQEKLINLYKNTSNESEDKVDELTKAVDELQKLLNQASEVYAELQAERERDNSLSQELINDRDAKIESLQKELVNANELLEVSRSHERQLSTEEDAEIVSSAAATVSRLLKSGMTLTQIYNEYVKVSTALQCEKDENKRLSDYLNRIVSEIDEKAPIIRKQRADYERALEAVSQLTNQLDNAMMECERCRMSAESDHRRCSELSRENHRFKQQTNDLSRQVKLLLKELEESRGKIVHLTPYADSSPAIHCSSSATLISEKLVTFRNIEELHDQNQKLLLVVRELSEAQEEKDMETGDKKVAELQHHLDMALKEIEVMKDNRQRQAEMVESIVQQRDMYRILATQPVASPKITPVKSTPSAIDMPLIASSSAALESEQQLRAQENEAALKALQEEMSIYRREKAENERMLNEQLEKTIKESSTLRLQNAKLLSQLDFTGERLKIIQSNSESHHKEIELLKDKNNKLMTSIAKHQQSVTMLQQDLMSTQEKLTRSEVRCQNLVAEKDSLKSSEARIHNEIESMRRNQQSRDELVLRLESIQNNLERSEFDVKTRLTQQIEKLERENAVLRKKVEGTDEQQRAFVNTLELNLLEIIEQRQLSEARQDMEKEREQGFRIAEQLKTSNEHIDFLKIDLLAAQENVQVIQEKLNNLQQAQLEGASDDRVQYELTRYRDLLADSTRELLSVKSRLEQSELDCQQHRSVADNVERSLHEHMETSDKFRCELEQRVNDVTYVNETLQARIAELEKLIAQLSDDNKILVDKNVVLSQENCQLVDENSSAAAQHENELTTLRNELEIASEQLSISQANEKAARLDCETQAAEARIAQEKYEEEMHLRAADLENLSCMSEELTCLKQSLDKATSDGREAQAALESSQASWVEVEQVLRSEITKLTTKLGDLETQNSNLHDQLNTMSAQMLQLQGVHKVEQERMQLITESVDDESTSSSASVEQLLEVVRFLRKEKELVEARFELLHSETTRLRQQNAHLKQQSEMTEKVLAEELENNQVNLQTAAQHAELMRKVESLNLLQDTNRQLVEDNNRIASQLDELTMKSKQLEDEIGPLGETCREVTAQRDMLQKEIEILQSELGRWKSRTNHLIDQCNKFDPEDHKKAIFERDEIKRELTVMTEEANKQRLEASQLKEQLQTVSNALLEVKSMVNNKDSDIEEKNTTIAQLRKIGRKYRLQAEELQKELDELKAKTVADQESSQSDCVEIRARLTALEQEKEEMMAKLGSADFEKNEVVKRVVDLEQRECELIAQITKLSEENNNKLSEYESLNKEYQSLADQQKKDLDERTRVESENATMVEDKKKLVATLQSAKQRLVALRSEKEQLEATCTELRKQVGAGSSQVSAQKTADSDKTAEITRLESELTELQQSRLVIQLENQQQLETIEKLRRDNLEIQQKLLQCQRDLNSSKMPGASPAKPTVLAPPVERAATVGALVEQPGPLRKANIRPMASQQIHIRSVQPVRSSATEPRAMASIRPMAAAVMSSSNASTPMATVMPTTAAMSENEGLLSLASVVPQSNVQQQSGRPTQQVQPVPSHFEEATVSSSEEQQQDAPLWWPFEATPSTSSEHGSTNSGVTGLCKRPRDDSHNQEDGPSEADNEAPTKRSKGCPQDLPTRDETRQSASEMADTTETSSNAVLPQSAESEREAASISQIDMSAAESAVEVRRETEPVSTSLSMEEHSRSALDRTQDDYIRKALGSLASGQGTSSDDLPDYQEQSEQATLDYDIRPSTSHANSGTPLSDDNGDQAAGEEYQAEDDVGDNEQGMDDDDIILVDDDDSAGVDDGDQGANEEYRNSDDEAEQIEDGGDYYPAEEDDYEIDTQAEQGEEPDEGEEGYDADDFGDKEADQEEDEVDDVIIVDESSARRELAGRSSGPGVRLGRTGEHAGIEGTEGQMLTAVSTSVPSQSHATLRPMVMPVVSSVSATVAVVPTSTSSVRPSMPSVSAVVRQQQTLSGQLSSVSRSQLMPFLFGSESAFGSSVEFDDGIVPSTPTLQLPRTNDGFAEAVCSPQVHDDNFMFGSAEVTHRSELAHQEGVGVDDTRMDLSQFDETGRVLATSQPVLDLADGAESSDFDAQGESTSTVPSADDQARSSGLQDEQPSTSQQDRTASQDKSDSSQSQNKPKIQRIIWEPEPRGFWEQEPRSSSQTLVQSSGPASASVQGTVAPVVSNLGHMSARRGATPRGSFHAVSGSQQGAYRGALRRGSPRMSGQSGAQASTPHRQPGAVLPMRHPQVARRARGRGASGPRGYYHSGEY